MNRRAILGAAAAAAPAALAAPALAQSAPEVRWRCSSSFPRNLDVLFGTGERIAQRVAAITENRFQIRFFPGGEVVPPLQVLDAVQAGTIEAGHTPPYYYVGKDPAFAFSTAVPFGLNTRMNTAWMTQGGGSRPSRAGKRLPKVLISSIGASIGLSFPARRTESCRAAASAAGSARRGPPPR